MQEQLLWLQRWLDAVEQRLQVMQRSCTERSGHCGALQWGAAAPQFITAPHSTAPHITAPHLTAPHITAPQ